jgi:RNA polymerase sigma-70 factor (ECF subfamily)
LTRASATGEADECFGGGGVTVEKVEVEPRLSHLTTQWTLVFQTQSGTPEQVHRATSQLMCRYAGAVHRYLLKALRDPEAAEELDQEFAVRFLRGDFRKGDPSKGRFRDYVKRAVQNLMKDYYRRKRPVRSLDSSVEEPAVRDEGLAQFDRQFLVSWRNDLLDRAWGALEEQERMTGHPYHTILRLRVDQPELNSTECSQQLSRTLGRPLTAGAFRQALQRARRQYAAHLIAEVEASLHDPTPEAVEEELADLELLDYCKPYVK